MYTSFVRSRGSLPSPSLPSLRSSLRVTVTLQDAERPASPAHPPWWGVGCMPLLGGAFTVEGVYFLPL
jgi:hypothetical protein